jgi:prophage antirepressor-like protein
MLNLFKRRSNKTQLVLNNNLLVKQFQDFNIEIHGTVEDPLFKANAICNLLDIDQKTIQKLDDQSKINVIDKWFLTEDGLYEIIFMSSKQISKDFKVWIRNIIKEIRLNKLQKQLDEKDKLLQLQSKELVRYKTLTYEEVEKTGKIYILSTDKQGVTKCGRTKRSVQKRIDSLQTACVETIQVLFEYDTSNDILLESLVHYILDRYRCNYNREHFRCDIEYMKLVIQTAGKMIDTLKSSFETISKEELLEKLGTELYYETNESETNEEINQYEKPTEFYNWLDQNLTYSDSSSDCVELKTILELFLNKQKIAPKVASKYRKEIEKYIKEHFKTIKWEYDQFYINSSRFRGWQFIKFQ